MKFFITPSKQKRNKSNLIESFKLPRILNSLKISTPKSVFGWRNVLR